MSDLPSSNPELTGAASSYMMPVDEPQDMSPEEQASFIARQARYSGKNYELRTNERTRRGPPPPPPFHCRSLPPSRATAASTAATLATAADDDPTTAPTIPPLAGRRAMAMARSQRRSRWRGSP